jgi:polysaccharide export outer membrane protein
VKGQRLGAGNLVCRADVNTVGAMRSFQFLKPLVVTALLFSGGCALYPAAGPQSWDVRSGQKSVDSLAYAFLKLTPQAVATLARFVPRLAGAFPDRSAPNDIRYGIGDIVSVTIFEAAAGGLFIPAEASVRPGNFITLPNQQVDSKGNISVPYAGNIRADGKTQVEVQQEIVNALRNRAIEPQAVVSLIEQRTSLISVLGEVNSPSRFPASHVGERLLDAITRAGGPKGQGYDLWVMLERQGRRAISPFGALVYEPVNNIYVHANDAIYLYNEPQTFLAFGATVNQQKIAFDAWRLSLGEAIAKVGGLSDSQADPASVFLYRGETREVAMALGLDCSKFDGPIIPVIYNLDLRDPAGYFLATSFEMRNKDVIYVSNAISVEISKALNFFRLVVGTVDDPINAAIAFYTLKAAIAGPATGGVTTIVTTPVPIAPVP